MSFAEQEKVYRAEKYREHKKLAMTKYPGLPINYALKMGRADNRKEPCFDYKTGYEANKERLIEKAKQRNKDKPKLQNIAKTPYYESGATTREGFKKRFGLLEQKGFSVNEINQLFILNRTGKSIYEN